MAFMDDMAFMADYPERMQQERREEVAQLQAERLMAQWEALQAARAATVTAKKYEASERQKFPDNGSDKSEDRVLAFEFAKAATLRMK
jgi:hypothetical protein